MPTTTARILNSSGLSVNVGAIEPREFGTSIDDERPVVGTTVGGAKWIGTEDFFILAVPSPSAIPLMRRSITVIHADTASAGANIAIDIQAGCEVAGSRCVVTVTGVSGRLAVITYAPGKTFSVAVGSAILFLWTGSEFVPQDPNSYQLAFNAAALGLPFDPTDQYVSMKQSIALRHAVGDLVHNEPGNDPVTYANSQSTANPTNPEYNPCIPRGDGDHDISTTQTTQAVIDKFRTKPLTVGGYSSYAVTVSGSTITVTGPNAGVIMALVTCLQNLGFVNRWKSSGESATYAASGVDFTYASRIYCVTIAGVDYPITAVSVGSSTITVTGTPASGSQTLYVYPMRIAGSTTSARLRSLAGFVPVPAGDGSMTIMAMAQLMDTVQIHEHAIPGSQVSGSGAIAGGTTFGTTDTDTSSMIASSGGTPRTAKNTSPRTIGVNMYTWLGVLLATSWTTA